MEASLSPGMMGLREFLNTTAGRAAAIVLAIVALGFGAYQGWNMFQPSGAGQLSRDRVFIDADTGKPFEYELRAGDRIPVKAPSGKESGYPAELCFWTKDGKPKTEPTVVLLNESIGKNEPTFCPDCGRLVVGHNPRPGPNSKAPPTKDEYRPRGR